MDEIVLISVTNVNKKRGKAIRKTKYVTFLKTSRW